MDDIADYMRAKLLQDRQSDLLLQFLESLTSLLIAMNEYKGAERHDNSEWECVYSVAGPTPSLPLLGWRKGRSALEKQIQSLRRMSYLT
mgnify:FL=1